MGQYPIGKIFGKFHKDALRYLLLKIVAAFCGAIVCDDEGPRPVL